MTFLLLKRLWPYLAGAVLILGLVFWHQAKVKAAYQAGVQATEDAQAEVVARVRLENERLTAAQAIKTTRLETELEGKNHETETLTANVAALARSSRLCLADKIRSNTVPTVTETPGSSDGTSAGQNPTQDLGEVTTAIIAECQRSTDKLIALQAFLTR